MLNIKYRILVMLLFTTSIAKSQDIIGLDSILSKIRANNPQLKMYDYQIESQKAKVEGANSWMAPMLGAGTFMTPYPGQSIMEDRDKGSLMFLAEQSIANKSKNKAKENYLAAQANITSAAKAMNYNELKALAQSFYYSAIINTKKLNLLNENLHIMTNLKKLAEIRYQYNKGNLSQIYKADGRIYETHNMIIDAKSNIETAKVRLNVLMNNKANENINIDTTLNINFNPLVALDTSYLLQNKSEIKMQSEEIKSLELNAVMIRNEAKPEFKIQFNHMLPLSSMMPQQYSAMGMITIPIAPWSSKAYKSELKANRLEIMALQQNQEATINETYGMIRSLEKKISSMEHHITMYQNNIIPAMKKNLDVMMLSYQENKEELPMVIDAWETLNKVQLDYLNELENYYQMIIEYDQNIER